MSFMNTHIDNVISNSYHQPIIQPTYHQPIIQGNHFVDPNSLHCTTNANDHSASVNCQDGHFTFGGGVQYNPNNFHPESANANVGWRFG